MRLTKLIVASALGFNFNSVVADASSDTRGSRKDSRRQLLGAAHHRILEKDQSGTFLMKDIHFEEDQPKVDASGKKKPHHTMTIELDNGLIYTLDNVDPTWAESKSGKGLKSGKDKITIRQGAIISGGSIDLQGGAPEVSEEEEVVKGKSGKYGPAGGRQLENDEEKRNLKRLHRQLQDSPTFGEKTVLAVRVVTTDDAYGYSEEYLSEKVFGTSSSVDPNPMNLISQYNACSYNQLNFVKTTHNLVSNGVVTITVPTSTSQGKDVIVNNVTSAINEAFSTSSPNDIAAHVIYCLPPSAMGDSIAYAFVNHWLSVYNNEWCNYPSALMHEIGHNLGFGHAGEGAEEYGDQSGMMGYSYSQEHGPAMCFNGAKLWQTDWYQTAAKTINPATASPTGNGDTCFTGLLYGVADFEVGNGAKIVVVKINDPREEEQDFYVAFNRATGINSGTREGRNQVLVTTTGEEGRAYSESTLLAKLNAIESYTISNFAGTGSDLTVSVDSIETSSNPGFAQVRIEIGGEQCEGTFSPTPAPSTSPTISCSGGKILRVHVTTDDYPTETSWILKNTCTDVLDNSVDAGTLYTAAGTSYSNAYCVTDAAYTFTIIDSYGDGICCNYGQGSYSVQYDGVVVASGGQFMDPEITSFGNCGGEPTSSPTFSPTTASPTRSLAPESTDPPTSKPTNLPTPEPTDLPTDLPTSEPTNPPTNPPSNMPTNLSTNLPTQFCSDGKIVTVNVTTDNYPGETSWILTNTCTSAVIQQVDKQALYKAKHTSYSNDYCVTDAAYEFTITDVWGDGICCGEGSGSYSVQYDGAAVASGGEFASSESTPFGSCVGTCSGGKIVRVDISTDHYYGETSWTLTNTCTDEVIVEVGRQALYRAADTFYSNEYCVADAAYQFTIADSWGDGICCGQGSGSYSVQYDGAVVASGGEFTSSESKTFGRC